MKKPKMVNVTVDIDDKDYKMLTKLAKARGISISECVVAILEEMMALDMYHRKSAKLRKKLNREKA